MKLCKECKKRQKIEEEKEIDKFVKDWEKQQKYLKLHPYIPPPVIIKKKANSEELKSKIKSDFESVIENGDKNQVIDALVKLDFCKLLDNTGEYSELLNNLEKELYKKI